MTRRGARLAISCATTSGSDSFFESSTGASSMPESPCADMHGRLKSPEARMTLPPCGNLHFSAIFTAVP